MLSGIGYAFIAGLKVGLHSGIPDGSIDCRLTLVKALLEAILVCLQSLAYTPKGILHRSGLGRNRERKWLLLDGRG
jgi:hypothetical protein